MCELGAHGVALLTFPTDDVGLAQRSVGALLDAVLSDGGATVEELDVVNAALLELLEAVAAAGPLRDAVVEQRPDGQLVVRLCHAGPAIRLDREAELLVGAAFPVVRVSPAHTVVERSLRSWA